MIWRRKEPISNEYGMDIILPELSGLSKEHEGPNMSGHIWRGSALSLSILKKKWTNQMIKLAFSVTSRPSTHTCMHIILLFEFRVCAGTQMISNRNFVDEINNVLIWDRCFNYRRFLPAFLRTNIEEKCDDAVIMQIICIEHLIQFAFGCCISYIWRERALVISNCILTDTLDVDSDFVVWICTAISTRNEAQSSFHFIIPIYEQRNG